MTITLKWNTYLATSLKMYVLAPQSFERVAPLVDDSPDRAGYESRIWYKCKDQYGVVLPRAVDMNEEWTSGITPEYPGETWNRPIEDWWPQADPAHFADRIKFWETVDPNTGQPYVPQPLHPQDPGATTRVQSWGQQFYVGAATPPNGKPVHWDTLRRYRGYGRHE